MSKALRRERWQRSDLEITFHAAVRAWGDVEGTIVDLTTKLMEAMRVPRERAGPRRQALRGVQEDSLVPGPVADRAGGTGHRSTVSMGHGRIAVVVVAGPERERMVSPRDASDHRALR